MRYLKLHGGSRVPSVLSHRWLAGTVDPLDAFLNAFRVPDSGFCPASCVVYVKETHPAPID